MGSIFTLLSSLCDREILVGEGEQGDPSLSVLLMPLPSTSILCGRFDMEFRLELSVLFFMALGEKSAGWVCGGG